MTNIDDIQEKEAARKALKAIPPGASLLAYTDRSLTPQAQTFVVEYMTHKNVGQAYLKSGHPVCDVAAARIKGMQLLRVPKIRAEVDRLQEEILEHAKLSCGLTLERLFTEVARGAFFDARKLFDDDGNPLPIEMLDDDTASAIESIEVATELNGQGENRRATVVRRYKLSKRFQYVDAGLKLFNAFKADKEAGSGAGAVNALTEMLGSMRKSALPVVEQVDDDDDLR